MYFFVNTHSLEDMNTIYGVKYMNSFCSQNCIKNIVNGKLQCCCGEDIDIFNWSWSKTNSTSNTRISDNNKEVVFHPLYSSGTAVVRGDVPLQPNRHYYWEIKIISKLYGTDVMVGIGTPQLDFSDWKFRFCSVLGIDSQSWGYSYHGNIHHNRQQQKYGSRFGLGSIVGVHLDMCTGTLEYFLNRKPLGIAFRGLKNYELYPMVSSTAAESAIKIICAVSEEATLQMHCLELISKYPALYKKYKEIPGLTRYCERKYFWIVPKDEDDKKREVETEEEVNLTYTNFNRNGKKMCTIHLLLPEVLNLPESGDSTSCINMPNDYCNTSNQDSPTQCQSSCLEDVPSTSKQDCDDESHNVIM